MSPEGLIFRSAGLERFQQSLLRGDDARFDRVQQLLAGLRHVEQLDATILRRNLRHPAFGLQPFKRCRASSGRRRRRRQNASHQRRADARSAKRTGRHIEPASRYWPRISSMKSQRKSDARGGSDGPAWWKSLRVFMVGPDVLDAEIGVLDAGVGLRAALSPFRRSRPSRSHNAGRRSASAHPVPLSMTIIARPVARVFGLLPDLLADDRRKAFRRLVQHAGQDWSSGARRSPASVVRRPTI